MLKKKWILIVTIFAIQLALAENVIIQVFSPTNPTYNNTNILVNFSASADLNVSSLWFNDGNSNITYNEPVNVTANEGLNMYTFYANDTNGTENSTSVTFFVDSIAPIFSDISESVANNSAYSSEQEYNFNVTVTDDNLDSVWIDFNGTNYTVIQNNSGTYMFNISDLPAGTYNYRWWANDSLGNLNNSESYDYYVAKGIGLVSLTFDKNSPQNYSTTITPNCSIVKGNGITFLMLNGTEIISGQPLTLGAGPWNFTCSLPASQNYTAASTYSYYQINKATPELNITRPQVVTYLNETTVEGSGCPSQLTCNLYRNGTLVSNPDTNVLGGGIWNYAYNTSGNANYTSASINSNVTVNPESRTSNLSSDKGWTRTYDGSSSITSCNVSAGSNDGEMTFTRNGISISSPDIVAAANEYNYSCQWSAGQNYTASSEVNNTLLINQASGQVSLLLNGQSNDITIDYPQQYNITASTIYGNVTILMDGNDVTSENGINVTPAKIAHIYNITAISSGDENHTSISLTRWLNVTLDTIPPLVNISNPINGTTYSTNQISINISLNKMGTCIFNIDNGTNIFLNTTDGLMFYGSSGILLNGAHMLYAFCNDSLGNENNSVFSSFMINVQTGCTNNCGGSGDGGGGGGLSRVVNNSNNSITQNNSIKFSNTTANQNKNDVNINNDEENNNPDVNQGYTTGNVINSSPKGSISRAYFVLILTFLFVSVFLLYAQRRKPEIKAYFNNLNQKRAIRREEKSKIKEMELKEKESELKKKKKEVDESKRATSTKANYFESLIERANSALESNDMVTAAELYSEMNEVYSSLSDEEQSKFYHKALEIYNKIDESSITEA
jgi:hypothetical protein